MILDIQTIADLYFYTCEGVQYPIDLNNYADSIKDTIDFILGCSNDPLLAEESGRDDILFAIVEILKMVHSDPTNKRFNKIASMIPYELYLSLDRTNNDINRELLRKGIKPKDIFIKSSRYVKP